MFSDTRLVVETYQTLSIRATVKTKISQKIFEAQIRRFFENHRYILMTDRPTSIAGNFEGLARLRQGFKLML